MSELVGWLLIGAVLALWLWVSFGREPPEDP